MTELSERTYKVVLTGKFNFENFKKSLTSLTSK